MLVWLLSVLGGFVFLSAIGRYNTNAVLRIWEAVLSPAGQEALRRLEGRVTLDAFLAERAQRKALQAHMARRYVEAARLIRLAAQVVAEAVPDRLTRLRAMAVCMRMASALVPLPPLLPSEFLLRQTATLAGLSAFFNHVLVATEERFHLRLWTLAQGYRFVRHVARLSSEHIAKRPQAGHAWSAFDAAVHDLASLDRGHVEALRVLLIALQS